MEELKGKAVLLLAPKFFGYEFEIKKELENFGAEVFYFDERPDNDFFTKAFIRLNLKKLIKKKIDSYYDKIIKLTQNRRIDILFLVNTETIDIKKIISIKNLHKDIKIYTYMWDSIQNKKKSLDLLAKSDKFFTFDSIDKVINNKIRFLPLFYMNDYKDIAKTQTDFLYDISFIGTIHSDRYVIAKKIDFFANKNNLRTNFYFYSPSRVLFFFQKLFKKDFKKIDKSDVSFEPLDKSNVLKIIKKSRVIVDIQHPLQSGLTMRAIEMLGAKRKLITTNQKILEYDFYDENNIYVFGRNDIDININIDFFQNTFIDIDKNIYEKYSINEWIQKIFETEK
jgi:hypothetical protein